MSLFVDTSVWSRALRRDVAERGPEVTALVRAIERSEPVYITGLVLQELLQGFSGPRDRERIIERLAALPLLAPDRLDHINAADLRNRCRRAGIQVATVDALLAQLCIRHGLAMLSTDDDFRQVAREAKLRVWSEKAGTH